MTESASESKIDALVRLLGDDDEKIVAVAWENLEQIGAAALPRLEAARAASGDERVRMQSGSFLCEWRRREVFRSYVQFCRQAEVDLEQGVFLIAASEHPEEDMAPCVAVLDRYARVLEKRLATARSTEEAVQRINHLLFAEMGFRGNAQDYYNPENSYINSVISQRKGIPISLATVYLLVARRLGVPVSGVGMPQHFLLKYLEGGRETFIDAFRKGRLYTVRDCMEICETAGVAFQEEHLAASSDRDILLRTLGNLLRIYVKAEDRRRSERIAAMVKLLGAT